MQDYLWRRCGCIYVVCRHNNRTRPRSTNQILLLSMEQSTTSLLLPKEEDAVSGERNSGFTDTQHTNRIKTILADGINYFVKGVAKDFRDFDASVNFFLFGVIDFDETFIETDHRDSAEWGIFKSKSIPPLNPNLCVALLANDPKLAKLLRDSGLATEAFWELWQFYCFLKDQKGQKEQKEQAIQKGHSEEINLIKESKWDEWE